MKRDTSIRNSSVVDMLNKLGVYYSVSTPTVGNFVQINQVYLNFN